MKNKIFFKTNEQHQHYLQQTINLAQILQPAFDCIFIIDYKSVTIKRQLKKVDILVCQLPNYNNLWEEAHFIADQYLDEQAIMVLYGQKYRSAYQEIIKGTGCHLVCLDDDFQIHYRADVVINDLTFDEGKYTKLATTKLCLGLDYLLINKQFLVAKKSSKQEVTIQNWADGMLVYLEERADSNYVLPILKMFEKKKIYRRFKIIVHKNYRYHWSLYNFCQHSSLDIEIFTNPSITEKIALMQRCNEAVCLPNRIALTYLFLGGDLYLYPPSSQQSSLCKLLLDKGVAFSLTHFNSVSIAKLRRARKLQEVYFKGQNFENIIHLFQNLLQRNKKNPVLQFPKTILLRA